MTVIGGGYGILDSNSNNNTSKCQVTAIIIHQNAVIKSNTVVDHTPGIIGRHFGLVFYHWKSAMTLKKLKRYNGIYLGISQYETTDTLVD